MDRRPSGRCHIEGAERSWEVRRDTFNGLDREVSSVVAEPRSLKVVRYSELEKGITLSLGYRETSCSSDEFWRARSKVAKDLSVDMTAVTSLLRLTHLTDLGWPLHLREVLKFARNLSTAEAVLGLLVLPGDHHSYALIRFRAPSTEYAQLITKNVEGRIGNRNLKGFP